MNIFFLLPLLATMAITVPVNPNEPSVAHSTIANVIISSTPTSVKIALLSNGDRVQIPHSIELDEESDESNESDESDESNESESQNSKEVLASHHSTNETKNVQASKDSADVSTSLQKMKPSPTLDKTTLSVKMFEPDATTVSVITISNATFLSSTVEPNTSPEVLLYLNTN